MKKSQPLPYTTQTPLVDGCIQACIEQHPGQTPRALAVYFEAVHQELAPLARKLEQENQQLRAQLGFSARKPEQEAQ